MVVKQVSTLSDLTPKPSFSKTEASYAKIMKVQKRQIQEAGYDFLFFFDQLFCKFNNDDNIH